MMVLESKVAEFEARGTPAKACKCCGATDVALMKCAGCKAVCYCSPKSQKMDWKEGGENRACSTGARTNVFGDQS